MSRGLVPSILSVDYFKTLSISSLYRMFQDEVLLFWEAIVSVILSKKCICTCVLFLTVSEMELFHCTDEQHAMFSHELQRALMSKAEFFENVLYPVNCTNFYT
jgi:hypothetical protein